MAKRKPVTKPVPHGLDFWCLVGILATMNKKEHEIFNNVLHGRNAKASRLIRSRKGE
jgi:hypothetical protein